MRIALHLKGLTHERRSYRLRLGATAESSGGTGGGGSGGDGSCVIAVGPSSHAPWAGLLVALLLRRRRR